MPPSDLRDLSRDRPTRESSQRAFEARSRPFRTSDATPAIRFAMLAPVKAFPPRNTGFSPETKESEVRAPWPVAELGPQPPKRFWPRLAEWGRRAQRRSAAAIARADRCRLDRSGAARAAVTAASVLQRSGSVTPARDARAASSFSTAGLDWRACRPIGTWWDGIWRRFVTREAARPREDWVRGFAEERPNELRRAAATRGETSGGPRAGVY
jgi:hypothetical protein